jgi:hypothetical protein
VGGRRTPGCGPRDRLWTAGQLAAALLEGELEPLDEEEPEDDEVDAAGAASFLPLPSDDELDSLDEELDRLSVR